MRRTLPSLPTSLLTSLALTAAVVAATAGTAQADAITHRDARHDVRVTHGATAPDNTDADVVRTRVDHRGAAVVTTIRLRDLTKAGQHQFVVALQVPHGGGTTRHDVYLDVTHADPQGEASLYGLYGDDESCPGLTTAVSYVKDLVTVRVPRGCLGAPAWVRAAVNVTQIKNHDLYLADDAFKNGGSGVTFTFTKKLYRA